MLHFLACARVIPSLARQQAGFCEAKSTLGSFSPLLAAPAAVIVSQLTAFLQEGTAKVTAAFGRLEGGWRGRGLFSPVLLQTRKYHAFWKPASTSEGLLHTAGDSAGEAAQILHGFLVFVLHRLQGVKTKPQWTHWRDFFFILKCAKAWRRPAACRCRM